VHIFYEVNMEKEKTENFVQKLAALCREYDLHDCVFAGTNDDDKMIGLFCVEREGVGFNIKNVFESSMNAARIYQAAREKMYYEMDQLRIMRG